MPPRLMSVALVAAAGALVGGCRPDTTPLWPAAAGPKVVASFPPIASLAMGVAGPDATVRTVMTSQGPHHFDATRAEAGLLRQADVLFLNGLDLDTRVGTRLAVAAGGRALKVVELGALVDKRALEEAAHHEGEAHAGHQHAHGRDPHVWLGLDHAATFAAGIRDELKRLDPAHAAGYDARTAALTAALAKLKADGLAAFKPKTGRAFVTFHESLAYFAKTFDLEIAAVIETVPGKEPTAADLQELVKACVDGKIGVIAVEPQYTTNAVAGRLLTSLRERGLTDVRLVEIDPLETADPAELTAGWYETKMRANITALAAALK